MANMANYKLNHSRNMTSMNNDYWTNSSQGFDKTWHSKQTKTKQFIENIKQGKHGTHELDVKFTDNSPHVGKVVCKTCNKFVTWIPKYTINT